MNKYFRNLKQSTYNLILDLLGVEKRLTIPEWITIVISYYDNKLEELFDEEEYKINVFPSITYMTEVLLEINNITTINNKEYNIQLKQVGFDYVDKLIKKELNK